MPILDAGVAYNSRVCTGSSVSLSNNVKDTRREKKGIRFVLTMLSQGHLDNVKLTHWILIKFICLKS